MPSELGSKLRELSPASEAIHIRIMFCTVTAASPTRSWLASELGCGGQHLLEAEELFVGGEGSLCGDRIIGS
jgi:hypothetical protein